MITNQIYDDLGLFFVGHIWDLSSTKTTLEQNGLLVGRKPIELTRQHSSKSHFWYQKWKHIKGYI